MNIVSLSQFLAEPLAKYCYRLELSWTPVFRLFKFYGIEWDPIIYFVQFLYFINARAFKGMHVNAWRKSRGIGVLRGPVGPVQGQEWPVRLQRLTLDCQCMCARSGTAMSSLCMAVHRQHPLVAQQCTSELLNGTLFDHMIGSMFSPESVISWKEVWNSSFAFSTLQPTADFHTAGLTATEVCSQWDYLSSKE